MGMKRSYFLIDTGLSDYDHGDFLEYWNENRDDTDFLQQFERILWRESKEATQKGFMHDLWFVRDVIGFIRKEKRLVYAGSNAAYSALAFAMGITNNIDPFCHGYFPEMLYGIRRNRRPIIPLIIPFDMEVSIARYLETVYGKDNVSYSDRTYTVSLNVGEEAYQFYLNLTRSYALSFAERMINAEIANGNTTGNTDKFGRCLFGRIDRNFSVPEEMQTLLASTELREVVTDFLELYSGMDKSIMDNRDRFVKETLDGTFDGLVKMLAATMGQNIWDGTESCAAAVGIFTRDDLFNWSVRFTQDKEIAFSIMEDIRKGKGREGKGLQKWKRYFSSGDMNASLMYYRAVNSIGFLVSERAVLPYGQILLYLADAKRRNRDLYQGIFREILEIKRAVG